MMPESRNSGARYTRKRVVSGDRETHRQQGDLIIFLLLVQNKVSRLKTFNINAVK
jgi:hypothetical protein